MKWKPRQEDGDFEVDLAPMLALMVTLIPMLLLSSAFVPIKVIESKLPQGAAIKKSREKSSFVKIYIRRNQTLELRLKLGTNGVKHVLPAKNNEFDFERANQLLSEFKSRQPDLFHAEIYPDSKTPYQQMITLMDQIRYSKTMTFPSVKSSSEQTDLLFPKVVIANVIGG